MLAALALAALVAAANERAVRKSAESEMRVVAPVVIGPDGKLQSYFLAPGYPVEVEALVKRYLADRSFDVVTASGTPETVKAVMSLQVVARRNDRGGADISIGDSRFQEPGEPRYIKVRKLTPPEYPPDALRYGFTGVVYLALRLDPDGRIAQTHVEQVNMTRVASERELQHGRELLAKAAVGRAKDWTFEVAPEALAKQDPVTVRIAVAFENVPSRSQAEQNQAMWQQYVPGPHSPIPWLAHSSSKGLGAMVPGWLFPLESNIRLRER